MSRGVNRVTLIGNLGRDPETRYLDSGAVVTSFSVGTNEEWKDKSGEKQSRCEWHNCTAWGKLAEVCAEYLKKGSQVYIEGSIRTEKYEKNGEDRYATKIVVREMQMLGGRREGGPQGQAHTQAESTSQGADISDDIPFGPHERGMIA